MDINSSAFSLTLFKKLKDYIDSNMRTISTIKGDQGPKGEKGDQGPKGDKGDTGEQGLQGPKGDTGEQGLKGDTGEQGPKGDKGDQGPKGDTGEQGLKGDTGEQGPKGDKGDKGDQGPKGDKGDTGEQGLQGPKGDTGEQGPKGDKGDKGDTGEQGPKGDKGDQGPKGDKGDTGEQGLQGPKGDIGEQGPKGDQGPKGEDADITPLLEKVDQIKGELEKHIDLKSEKLNKLFNDFKIQINNMVSNKIGGSSSGGGSYSILDNRDVEMKRRSEIEGNSILVFNSDKQKFVSESLLEVIERIKVDLEVQYNKIIDVEGNITYIGEALPGTSNSDSTWRIKRIETIGDDIIIMWANGTADFVHSWNNRAIYTYN